MKRSQSVKPEIKAQVKQKTQQKILEEVPSWKQDNLQSYALQLINKRVEALLVALAVPDPLTAEEQATLVAIEGLWESIKSIRAHSDSLESAVDSGEKIDTDIVWPT